MIILSLMLFVGFPAWTIWLTFKCRKQDKQVRDLKNTSVSKSDYDKVRSENLELTRKLWKDEQRQKLMSDIDRTRDDLVAISVDKDLIRRSEINPSNLSKDELEACMNYFIDHHVKR